MNLLLKIKKLFFIFVPIFLLTPVLSGLAYEIRDTSTEVKGDFVLEPAKLEVFLDPGTSKTEFLNILNRTGKTLEFKIEIEDFSGSHDPNQTVILSGEEKGPYSLRDYLNPEIDSFSLQPGQKITFPVDVNIPLDAEPGGLYGSILVSSEASVKDQSGTTVVSRLGALFFVNVNGEVVRSGELTSFTKVDSEDKGVSFELLFENTGNAHLNPYGVIRIFNLVGTQISEIEVEPYFAMPDSVRFRKVAWNTGKLFGRYKAVASINRGYDDKVDELSLVFWVISAKILITIIGGIILLLLLIIFLVKKFDFKITKDGGNEPPQPKPQQLEAQIPSQTTQSQTMQQTQSQFSPSNEKIL